MYMIDIHRQTQTIFFSLYFLSNSIKQPLGSGYIHIKDTTMLPSFRQIPPVGFFNETNKHRRARTLYRSSQILAHQIQSNFVLLIFDSLHAAYAFSFFFLDRNVYYRSVLIAIWGTITKHIKSRSTSFSQIKPIHFIDTLTLNEWINETNKQKFFRNKNIMKLYLGIIFEINTHEHY